MQAHVKELFEQVNKMPVDDQIELADLIYLKAGLPAEEWEAAWGKECEQRLSAYERGETEAVDAEVMHEELKRTYGWQ
jgi:hypothetical protein